MAIKSNRKNKKSNRRRTQRGGAPLFSENPKWWCNNYPKSKKSPKKVYYHRDSTKSLNPDYTKWEVYDSARKKNPNICKGGGKAPLFGKNPK